jgi:chitosanase
MTELQKLTAQAIVNIFETGKALGNYGQVTLIKGDSGHLTYGRSQTTLASGNLSSLIADYCAASGATFASQLSPYLDRLRRKDLALDNDTAFRALLKSAGDDPVMHAAQDAFFDRTYWNPSAADAAALGVATPLGTAVVYDGHIHGSWKTMRDRTLAAYGKVAPIGEQAWIGHYVDVRRGWLANHRNAALHPTVYRMDAFRALIAAGNWTLALPATVRGVKLTGALFTSGESTGGGGSAQVLRLANPMMKGDAVKALQKALAAHGIEVGADGVFGPGTEKAVIAFQRKKGLAADGVVGDATRAALGL